MELIKINCTLSSYFNEDYKLIASFNIPKIETSKYILIDIKIMFIKNKSSIRVY